MHLKDTASREKRTRDGAVIVANNPDEAKSSNGRKVFKIVFRAFSKSQDIIASVDDEVDGVLQPTQVSNEIINWLRSDIRDSQHLELSEKSSSMQLARPDDRLAGLPD